MIEELTTYVFDRIGHLWKSGGKLIKPTEEDVREVLDEAARLLYTEPIDSRLETGGLIIEKTDKGHDVYVFLGSYK